MRRVSLLSLLALVAASSGRAEAQATSAPRRPNIVVILADDLGHADVGFHGCKDIPTPRIDSIARGGVRCTNGYVSGPYCSPTRAGLLTGRYQQRFGHEFNPGDRSGEGDLGLPLSQTTIADRLKAAGYATGLVGKWHLGAASRFHPQKRGFDEFFGFLGGSHPYFPGQGEPIYRGTEVVKEGEYLTDAFAREAVAFIDRNEERPFFLYLAFNAVHTPMHATDPRLSRFAAITDDARRTYAAMLSAMDEGVGRVLDTLRDRGLEQDTLVVFLSDNGGPTMVGTTINASRNDPLRGSKRTTLEGGVRVPFAAKWPGRLPAGSVYEHPVIQLDLLPTLLAAAGVEAKPDRQLDGVNLIPRWTGRDTTPPHEALYWRLGNQMAIRRGDWKLVSYDVAADRIGEPAAREKGAAAKRKAKAKGAARKNAAPAATPRKLYNLASDVGEARDLSAQHPEKVRELEAAWREWDSQLARPLWGPGSRRAADAAASATR